MQLRLTLSLALFTALFNAYFCNAATQSQNNQFATLGIESSDSSSSGDAAMIVLSVLFTAGSVAMGYAVFKTWKNRQSYSVSSILPEDPKVSTGLRIDPTVLEIGAVLGHGSKGRVMKAMFRGSAVCVKELSVNSAPQKLEKELTELLQVRHPSLVLCMGLSVPAENKVWVVSEYMERGPLYRVLHDETAITLDWKQRIGMATSIAQAMNYLHQVRPGKDPVLHRRLNSLNVLITQNLVAKVSDYGLHGLFKSARDTDLTTKPFWTAPEVLKSGKYSTASDVYSFGVLLWEIVTRQRPFYHCKQMNTVQLIRAILNGERPTLLRTAPAPLQQLLQDCLHAEPSKRPKFDMIIDSLQLLESYSFNGDELMQIEIESGLERNNKGKLSSFAEIRGNNIDKSWMVKPSEFTIESELGHGSFGKVYTGTFRGKKVAIKKFSSNNFDHQRLNEFVRELQIMCSLHHPNTVLFMGACLEEDNICIIMEFCNRGTLHHVLHDKSQHIDYKRIIQILTGIAQGLNYLHLSRPPILHRDLKSLNILLDEDWNSKVSDFGLTRFKSDDLNPEETHAGTPFWMAPEVLESQLCSEAADVYSYGIIIQETFTRDNPFPGMNPHQVALEVITNDIRPEIPAFVPPRVQHLMRACWDRSPANRPTFSQVLEELKVIQSEGVPRIELSLSNARLYQKCHTVHAFRSKDQVTVFKSWGTGESKCGDWIIVGPGDDVYTCDAVIFGKTYEAVPNKKHCYRKTGRVLALKMPSAFLVETLEGTEHGLTGDYLAQNPIDGEQWPIAEETFESMYELSLDQTMPVRQELMIGAGRDLPPVAESEDTLSSAAGYLSANSHPPAAIMYHPTSNANSFLGTGMTVHSLPPSHSNVSSSSSFSTYNNNSNVPHSTATTSVPTSSYYGNQSAYTTPGQQQRGSSTVSKAQLSPPVPTTSHIKSASPSSAASVSAVEMESASEFGDVKLAPRPPSGPRPTSSGRIQVSRSGIAVGGPKETAMDYSKGQSKDGSVQHKADIPLDAAAGKQYAHGKSAEVANQFSEQY